MIMGQPFKFSIEKGFSEKDILKGGLLVVVENGQVHIHLNSFKSYRILSQREIIVGGINAKLKELIQMKLNNLATEEEEMEAGK